MWLEASWVVRSLATLVPETPNWALEIHRGRVFSQAVHLTAKLAAFSLGLSPTWLHIYRAPAGKRRQGRVSLCGPWREHAPPPPPPTHDQLTGSVYEAGASDGALQTGVGWEGGVVALRLSFSLVPTGFHQLHLPSLLE